MGEHFVVDGTRCDFAGEQGFGIVCDAAAGDDDEVLAYGRKGCEERTVRMPLYYCCDYLRDHPPLHN